MKTSKLPYSVSLQSLMSEVKKQEERERKNRAVSGSRAVRSKWHTDRQLPPAHGSSAAHGPSGSSGTRAVNTRWRTGRQSARGSRAVSPHVAHGPSVRTWLSGRQSPVGARAVSPRNFSWIVRLLARWSSVLGASRSAGWWWRVFGQIRPSPSGRVDAVPRKAATPWPGAHSRGVGRDSCGPVAVASPGR